ncbi:hypothetical protein [Moellerella wisconsensis]|nr:hypothetical protein [Moellerella wisconsensis]
MGSLASDTIPTIVQPLVIRLTPSDEELSYGITRDYQLFTAPQTPY